jgi:hypothetical protein
MLTYHTGLRFQQGRGLGSIFGAILRGFKPIAKMGLNAGKRFLKSDFAKNLASTALDMGKTAATNIAVDLLEGKKFSDSAQEQLEEAKSKIATTLKGEGCNKKRTALKGGSCNKKRKKRKALLSDLNPNKKIKYSLLDE